MKWPLDTILSQGHFFSTPGGWLNRTCYSEKSPWPEASASQRERHCWKNLSRKGLAVCPSQRVEAGLLARHGIKGRKEGKIVVVL
jgi:hypothetical protein